MKLEPGMRVYHTVILGVLIVEGATEGPYFFARSESCGERTEIRAPYCILCTNLVALLMGAR